ncbi:MAG: hypothetical protein AAF963_02615 [Bacteroidota bacterium]
MTYYFNDSFCHPEFKEDATGLIGTMSIEEIRQALTAVEKEETFDNSNYEDDIDSYRLHTNMMLNVVITHIMMETFRYNNSVMGKATLEKMKNKVENLQRKPKTLIDFMYRIGQKRISEVVHNS